MSASLCPTFTDTRKRALRSGTVGGRMARTSKPAFCRARATFSAEDTARLCASTSVCFDLSVFEIFLPLCAGDQVVLAVDPIRIPAEPTNVTLLNTVPSAIAELLRLRAIPRSVRVVNLAGEALQTTLVQQLHAETNVQRAMMWTLGLSLRA